MISIIETDQKYKQLLEVLDYRDFDERIFAKDDSVKNSWTFWNFLLEKLLKKNKVLVQDKVRLKLNKLIKIVGIFG